jgi:hypothetical protein
VVITVTIEPLATALERALGRFRVQTAHNLLDEAFSALPADAVAREVILPVYARVEAAGDPAVVRFATSVFELRLLGQARGWDRIDGPHVTLACAPGEWRTLTLITLGLGLAARSCRVDYLGADTPTTALHGDVIVVHADAGELEPDDGERLRALDVMLLGRAAAALGVPLGLTALPGDAEAAVRLAAELAHDRSSPAGDAASPDRA